MFVHPQHKALLKLTLRALRLCDVTRLSLAPCAGVADDWLELMAWQRLTHLDLSGCSEVTDKGLQGLGAGGALGEVRGAALRGCLGLK
jgi:hypothetical protein